jgi:hypothetical protein
MFVFSGFTTNKTSEKVQLQREGGCATVTLSCGITGPVCGENTTNLIRNVIFAENLLCDD